MYVLKDQRGQVDCQPPRRLCVSKTGAPHCRSTDHPSRLYHFFVLLAYSLLVKSFQLSSSHQVKNISATAVTEATRPGTTYAFVDVIASPRARCYSKIDSRVSRIPGSMVAHVGWVRVSMLLEISLFGASPTSLSDVLLITSHHFLERYSP
jgi:hypothetical protein